MDFITTKITNDASMYNSYIRLTIIQSRSIESGIININTNLIDI